MASQSVVINNVVYSAVPSVSIPKSGGGTAQFYDTSDADANAANTLFGVKGYNAAGGFTGALTVVPVSQDSTTKVLSIS